MKVIVARDIIDRKWPPLCGLQLADYVLENWRADLTIDLRKLPAGMLIASFFGAFLLQIGLTKPRRLGTAQKFEWLTDFDFQRTSIKSWIGDFEMESDEPPPEPCVTRKTSTCVYLKDGTKIVVKRDPGVVGRVWLEQEKQRAPARARG